VTQGSFSIRGEGKKNLTPGTIGGWGGSLWISKQSTFEVQDLTKTFRLRTVDDREGGSADW